MFGCSEFEERLVKEPVGGFPCRMPDHQVGVVLADQLVVDDRDSLHAFVTPGEPFAGLGNGESGRNTTAVHVSVEEGEPGAGEGVAHGRGEGAGNRVAD